jgi:hypothetical protein
MGRSRRPRLVCDGCVERAVSGPFTAIIEYWREDLQRPSMEVVQRQSLRSAQYVARKSLRTAMTRPGYFPECARIEDAQENVVCRYEWDSAANQAVLARAQS